METEPGAPEKNRDASLTTYVRLLDRNTPFGLHFLKSVVAITNVVGITLVMLWVKSCHATDTKREIS